MGMFEAKEVDWKQIAFQLRQRDSMNPQELMKRAEQEKVKNLRPSIVTRENVEQFETKISEQEVGEVFDGKAPGEEQPADGGTTLGEAIAEQAAGESAAPKKKSTSKKSQKQAEAPAPVDDGGEAPGEDVNL